MDRLVEPHELTLVGRLHLVETLEEVADRLAVSGGAALRGQPSRMTLEDDANLCDPRQ